jgi:glycosyltransferase involved in cell wall biosynthesis
MAENLGEKFEFLIVTRDRDFGVSEPYNNVRIDRWNEVGRAQVFYASPSMFSMIGFKKILNATAHDVLYLNSFFNPYSTASLLLLRRFGLVKIKPIVIAPRGEFSPNALCLKATKKRIYTKLSQLVKLYHGLIWQASSEHEAQNIRKFMGSMARHILVAPNMLSSVPAFAKDGTWPGDDMPQHSSLRLVFLSRISPMKNLDYLLAILKRVSAPMDFSIYGPLEVPEYWASCERHIRELPENINTIYRGAVTPADVPKVFAAHDVFFFPTRGENFGHVIFESLASGTCVVISDQTPWRADNSGAVEVIPLGNAEAWSASAERWAARKREDLAKYRESALTYARDYMATSPAVEQNRALFKFAYNYRY